VEKSVIGPGIRVDMEILIDNVRRRTTAVVVKTPFFDPPRKRAVVAA
jgi:glycine cleavage system aminomethyltransferase T